jgi:hypothetical protein
MKSAAVENSDSEDERQMVKAGFLISPENDFKLTALARKRRLSRSDMVNDAISELCRGVVVSFRGNASEAREAG